MIRQLQEGDRGNIEEAREAHRRLAAYIRESNIPEFERDCLAYMHHAIAEGVDARVACAVPHKRGQFSRVKRDVDIWFAIDRIAFDESIEWRDAAKKLHGNTKTAKRFGLNGKLPKSFATIENIYRKVQAAHQQANDE